MAKYSRFSIGILGPNLEAALRPLGLALRHFPQSFPFRWQLCSSLNYGVAPLSLCPWAKGLPCRAAIQRQGCLWSIAIWDGLSSGHVRPRRNPLISMNFFGRVEL